MMDVFGGLCLFLLLFGLIHGGWGKRDSSDGTKRSGMIVMTDYGTGVQYLMSPLGGLTVRVDENGKPVKAKRDADQR